MSYPTTCKECGGSDLIWFTTNINKTGIAEGRLRTHEPTCRFVLGCNDCSETLAAVDADRIADRMNSEQSELAALREELAALKAPGPLCFCGLKQTKNPHPEAGVPPGYLEVGTVYDCIPCLNKSRHAWSKKANRLQSELTAAEQRNAIMTECLERLRGCSQLRPTPSLIELIDSALETRDAKD